MNSCTSTLLSACAPPLMMFIIGTGSEPPPSTIRYCQSACFFDAATACAAAMETPSSALAPRLPLLSVPSRAMSFASRPFWSAASKPAIALAIWLLTLPTALVTPLPSYRFLSPSRSSTASRVPVEAPLGTAARPKEPSARVISASRVGLPRESRISRAWILVISVVMRFPLRVGMTKESTEEREPHGTDQDESVETQPDRAERAAAVLPAQGNDAQYEADEGKEEKGAEHEADEAEHAHVLLGITRGDHQRGEADAGKDDEPGNQGNDERGDAVTRLRQARRMLARFARDMDPVVLDHPARLPGTFAVPLYRQSYRSGGTIKRGS